MKARVARPSDCPASLRFLARAFGVLFLATAIVRGIVHGGHLDYPGSVWLKLPGRLAGSLGMAADDIQITGLQHHDAQEVLQEIELKPGAPLLSFDAAEARQALQALDWVDHAVVQRKYPNQLLISIEEREPFVAWQHAGVTVMVDKKGRPMSGIPASGENVLLHVSGAGANTAALELVNQLEAVPTLSQKVRAAARVGERRWTLYLNDGLKVALPEHDVEPALQMAQDILSRQDLPVASLAVLDLRISGEVGYQVAVAANDVKLPGVKQ